MSPKFGFTLIEIMLIVAALAVLAGATIIAINPGRQLADAHNGVRRADVGVLWNAAEQYALDNHGSLPAAIPEGILADCTGSATSTEFTICRTDACDVVLTELLEDGKYLSEIPADPTAATDDYSGYNIIKDTEHNNRVVVCAPAAEGGELIYLPN